MRFSFVGVISTFWFDLRVASKTTTFVPDCIFIWSLEIISTDLMEGMGIRHRGLCGYRDAEVDELNTRISVLVSLQKRFTVKLLIWFDLTSADWRSKCVGNSFASWLGSILVLPALLILSIAVSKGIDILWRIFWSRKCSNARISTPSIGVFVVAPA